MPRETDLPSLVSANLASVQCTWKTGTETGKWGKGGEKERDRLVEEGEVNRGRKSWRKLGCERDGEAVGKEEREDAQIVKMGGMGVWEEYGEGRKGGGCRTRSSRRKGR